jgi:SOS-response transcriptional repressor LexA
MILTARRRQILMFVADHTRRFGECPSFKEIGLAVGLASTSAVAEQIRRMRDAGLLDSEPLLNRTVRLDDTVTVWPAGVITPTEAITQTVLVSRCPRCRIDHPADHDCRAATKRTAPGLTTAGSR